MFLGLARTCKPRKLPSALILMNRDKIGQHEKNTLISNDESKTSMHGIVFNEHALFELNVCKCTFS